MENQTVNISDRRMSVISSVMLASDKQNSENIWTTTIGEFLNPKQQHKFYESISAIRELCPNLEEKLRNKQSVDALKKRLPAGILSGVTENGIGENSLIELNNVLQIDIDAQDNPELYDWEAVKDMLSRSPHVSYAGLSSTGLGVFALVPIEDATYYKQYFDAIEEDFVKTKFTIYQRQATEPTVLQGIKIDPAPSNPASKRFVSYDANPYWNTAAEVYTKKKEPIMIYNRNYTTSYTNGSFDIEDFFKIHNISYTMRARHGGTQYIVECPWIAEHSSRSKAESAVFVYPDGGIGYKCLHAHCADRHWRQYREFYEPGVYDRFEINK